jgi:hypothetical protein
MFAVVGDHSVPSLEIKEREGDAIE